jgi:hypothetical protein
LEVATQLHGRILGRWQTEKSAFNLSKAGWSWGCVATVDFRGRTIFVADAHRGDGKRFVVRADEKLTAFSGTQICDLRLRRFYLTGRRDFFKTWRR